MAGVSVTFEHLGIMEAAAAVEGSFSPAAITTQLNRATDAGKRNLGRVLDAWEAADGGFWATVVVAPFRSLEWLIATRQLGACSLTHVMTDPATATPLELSLVGVPARPGCLIRLATTSALATAMYKAHTISGGIKTIMPPTVPDQPTPTNAATTAATAIDALPVESRELIVAKLANLVAAVDRAETRATTAEQTTTNQKQELLAANTALAQQKLMADVDIGLLGAQIQQLCNAMPAEMLENFSVTAKDTIEAFHSGNPAKMATSALRTIMCANAAMMTNRPSVPAVAEPTNKRARVEESNPVTVPAVVADPHSLNQETLLARALFDSFETGV
jgi:hypothetical protein